MALAVTLQIDFKDNKNKSSFTRLRIPTGFTIAQMITFAQSAAQAVQNLSKAKVVGASLNVAIDISAELINVASNVLADVSEKALFMFNSVVAGIKARFNIPTFDETYVVPGSDQIDNADAPIVLFLTAIETGYALTGGSMAPVNKYGDSLTNHTEARELFVKRRW